MARFKSIVTDAGAAALTALIAAGKPLILTRAAAGSGVATVSPNTLSDLVTPENVAVSLGEKDLIEGDPAIMRIPVQVTNEALDAPVWIREVAVYGNTIGNTEVMFCYLIPAIFGEAATATGFYYSKAKTENMIKLRRQYGDLVDKEE